MRIRFAAADGALLQNSTQMREKVGLSAMALCLAGAATENKASLTLAARHLSRPAHATRGACRGNVYIFAQNEELTLVARRIRSSRT